MSKLCKDSYVTRFGGLVLVKKFSLVACLMVSDNNVNLFILLIAGWYAGSKGKPLCYSDKGFRKGLQESNQKG